LQSLFMWWELFLRNEQLNLRERSFDLSLWSNQNKWTLIHNF